MDEYLILRESDVLAKVVTTSQGKGKASSPAPPPSRRQGGTRHGSQGAEVQRGRAALARAWREHRRERGQGDARPEGPLRRARQEVRRADDHERRRHDRARDRGRGRLREPGRAARARGRDGDERRRRRRHDDGDRARPGDRPRGSQERRRRRQPDGAQARHRDGRRLGGRRPQVAVQGGLGQGGHRPRRHDLGARARDRRRHRRRDREGRQGRRRERRGGPDLRPRARVHRGHAVRQGLPVAVHDHRPRADGGGARGSVHPDRQPEDRRRQGHPAGARAGHPGRPAAADRGRGRRGRVARDDRRQQAARHVHRPSPSRRRASAIAASGCSRTSRS